MEMLSLSIISLHLIFYVFFVHPSEYILGVAFAHPSSFCNIKYKMAQNACLGIFQMMERSDYLTLVSPSSVSADYPVCSK